MTADTLDSKTKIIDKLIEIAQARLSKTQATVISKFIKQFYSTASFEDLQQHNFNDLYGSAIELWNFMLTRKTDEIKLRVYNPDFEEHGWQSTHTIIELVQTDSPFLVDSIGMEMNRLNMTVHLIIHIGGMKIKRDSQCSIMDILPLDAASNRDVNEEAIIYLEIDRQTDKNILKSIEENLMRVLNDVKMAVTDWQPMRHTLQEALDSLDKAKIHLQAHEITEAKDFLKWIMNDHFTFLGYRKYTFLSNEKGQQSLELVPNSSLGILRDETHCRKTRYLDEHTPEARELLLAANVIFILTKTNTFATVHRPAYTDNIIVKIFDEKTGKLSGIHSIIGLFTSAAYNTSPLHIPSLRHKVATVIKNSGINPKSHAGKTVLNILETLPRDDLFQASTEELLDLALQISHMQERQRIRVFARKDAYSRFISCLIYVPRERFNTELRQTMQAILAEAFSSNSITFSTRISDSALARIHFIIRNETKQTVEYDVKEIEARLVDAARTWEDELCEQLRETYGEERGNKMILRYQHGKAFPASYREIYTPRAALHDIKYLEYAFKKKKLAMNLYRPAGETENVLQFKVYQRNETVPLSDALPILEKMGLRVIGERPHCITLAEGSRAWINDFGMQYGENLVDVHATKEIFQDAFAHIWFGKVENDHFNRLSLSVGLNWREISILRAYAKYLRQIGFALSQEYIEETFCTYPEFGKNLITLFDLYFNPEHEIRDPEKTETLEKTIIKELDNVANLDQDRILRRYLDVIKATLRTNYYQINEEGFHKDYLSFKIAPPKIPDIPLPIPQFEIFVYSPRVEGLHLRFSKVARGGLRWSDRREDFRTEVLGLVKAQQVKNAVIVPSGAKGGFVAKCLPENGSREEILETGIACYKEFIHGLLDITDSIQGTETIPPPRVVRHDDDDPYLVVAADKGTATFSNIANEISQAYNFWLGDAFASGGSAGYDHKKMGITARGAWESVKRHFREMGVNTQMTDFTVIGIGDMAGDVFGNGMLLSRHIKLVAAFNHMHIFIDPSPDPEASYKERERLFHLPRSSWADYTPELISKGGGIFRRADKSIKLSAEIKKLTGLTKDFVEPNELLIALLKSPVDLLWNGGIGTFVKASAESNSEVGDRANDAIRVNATDLRCKVVGEGGNLGLTQLARVEYALNGGRIYTDFIDNSAGVDCSDHEVNIKILLNSIVIDADMTMKQRNQLLADMTDEVAQLVLLNNYRQTQAISLIKEQALSNIELHRRYIESLESSGKIDRSLEFLPDEKALAERKLTGKGLTTSGIAILLAYTKSILKVEILNSNLTEDHAFSALLAGYFPKPLREKFRAHMDKHPLRREIIATLLSNQIINQMSFTFIYRLNNETGAPTAPIVRAYMVAQAVFNLDNLWQDIESLDNKVSAQLQIKMMVQFIRLLRRSSRWFLRNRRGRLAIEETIEEFTPHIKELVAHLPQVLNKNSAEHFNTLYTHYTTEKAPESIAHRLACIPGLFSALDIIELAQMQAIPILEAARIYFLIGQILELDWVRMEVIEHAVDNYWEALSREALRDDIDWQQRQLTVTILQTDKQLTEEERVSYWMSLYPALVERWQYMLAELHAATNLNFTMFFVAIRELLDLTQTSLQATQE